MAEAPDDYLRPTTDFWQKILTEDQVRDRLSPPYRYGYPARLPDGRYLELPLRGLPAKGRAVASLIANQASLDVADTLAGFMAADARMMGAEIVIGMPTLGLVFAPVMARMLGHPNYVPLGYSRKYWYDESLSEPVKSITSPDRQKTIYLDPNMIARLRGKRAVIVDDAVSSGTTIVAVLKLLTKLDVAIAGISVAMRQGVAWREALATLDPAWVGKLKGVYACPLFERAEGGWQPIPGTLDG